MSKEECVKDELEQEAEVPETAAAETAEDADEGGKDKKKKKKLSKEAEALEKMQEEFDKYKANHLRVLAEYDNFRKRSQTEKTQIYNSAVSDTIAAILPVADNMERALSQENASAEDMKKGVEMIASQFTQCFEKLGITAVGTPGDVFDPAVHNAVSHIDSEDFGENTLSAVFQKGYTLGDKVVRHAMVQVAN